MRRKIHRTIPFLFLAVALFISTIGCRKETKEYDEYARDDLYDLMKEWYLWYSEMPTVNLQDYKSAQELLEDLRKDIDLWSYITTKAEYEQYYKAGEYIGFGFGHLLYQNSLYVTFVFKDSPLYGAGVARGWKIKSINGVAINDYATLFAQIGEDEAGVQRTFEFVKPDGSAVTHTFAKKVIAMNSVLHLDTLHVAGKIIGHLVLKSFIEPTVDELDSAFKFLNQNQVHELVLDLRYNGGGRLDVTTQLASLIGGPSLVDKTFIRLTFNDKKQSENEAITFLGPGNPAGLPVDYPINIQNLVVLTTSGTASASEAIINGFEPYLNVVSIGDNTYGKPVGTGAWYWDNHYAFVIVIFKLANANQYGDYFGGLPPDSYVADIPLYNFDDRRDPLLKEAIYYLSTGGFTSPSAVKSVIRQDKPVLRGLKAEIGAL